MNSRDLIYFKKKQLLLKMLRSHTFEVGVKRKSSTFQVQKNHTFLTGILSYNSVQDKGYMCAIPHLH